VQQKTFSSNTLLTKGNQSLIYEMLSLPVDVLRHSMPMISVECQLSHLLTHTEGKSLPDCIKNHLLIF